MSDPTPPYKIGEVPEDVIIRESNKPLKQRIREKRLERGLPVSDDEESDGELAEGMSFFCFPATCTS